MFRWGGLFRWINDFIQEALTGELLIFVLLLPEYIYIYIAIKGVLIECKETKLKFAFHINCNNKLPRAALLRRKKRIKPVSYIAQLSHLIQTIICDEWSQLNSSMEVKKNSFDTFHSVMIRYMPCQKCHEICFLWKVDDEKVEIMKDGVNFVYEILKWNIKFKTGKFWA